MPILPATTLDNSILFMRLQELEASHSAPMGLCGNVQAICREAADRLRIFPAIHGQYTLHDEVHCLRVVQLMACVATSVIEKLNAIEIAILILSAYLHDQGMVIDADEMPMIQSSDDWIIHEQNWCKDHPNYGECLEKLRDPLLCESEQKVMLQIIADLRAAMFTDFIRRTHGQRSAKFLQSRYGTDPRLVLNSRSVADLIALVCISHVKSPSTIIPENGYRFDELVGNTPINLALLAYILRLADILDFDRERTPESLYRTIHFSSPVSLEEWEKHRSVTGWDIAPDRIVFAAECKHPVYERAIKEFSNWIDSELGALETWCRLLPAKFQHYQIELPLKVDRTRVGPQIDPVTGQASYQYFDLEFSLSRDEIVKLLMTEGLYANESLFIRELLQNALDALRYRKALYQTQNVELPDLSVKFEHLQESGFDIVRCRDNGIGMNEFIITNFLTRVGRSYYRSPEFNRERLRFREKGCDFDPCARFGIGFMSCFMFGDEITIHSRRDYGMGQSHGDPIVVEIKGLSGMVVIRPGSNDQPVGTLIEIRGRRKSYTVDEWSDPVNLLDVLEGYALATEFTVIGDCQVPAIKERLKIMPEIEVRPHPLEAIEIKSKEVFAVDLATVDDRLRGGIRICMLIDETGSPTVKNKDATIEVRRPSNPHLDSYAVVVLADGKEPKIESIFDSKQVCCDGILVAGHPGREKRPMRLGHSSCNYGFGNATFLIDARGELKPKLTPARTPPNRSFSEDEKTWTQLFEVAGRAYSNLLDEILERCLKSGEKERFWFVAEAYDVDVYRMKLKKAWQELRLPLAAEKEEVAWHEFCKLPRLRVILPTAEKQSVQIFVEDGRKIQIPNRLVDLQTKRGTLSSRYFERLILATSTISSISSTELEIVPAVPNDNDCLADTVVRGMPDWRWFFRFDGDLKRAVCITGHEGFANSLHPVTIRGKATWHIPWHERAPVDRIFTRLIWGTVGERFDSDVPDDSWSAHTRKEFAMLYQAVDWSNVSEALRPPYYVFRPGFGLDELNTTHFEKWISG